MTTVRSSAGEHPVAPRRSRRRPGGRTWLVAAGFLAPAAVALLVLRLVPALSAVWESLFTTSLLTGERTFVGAQNYAELWGSPDFRSSLGITLLFSLIINPLQIAASFLLALLYTRKLGGSKLWRALVILPIATPPAVSAVVWNVIYRPDDGLANSFLTVLGIPAQPFLTSPDQALMSIMVLLSWIGVGYWMLFLIAGLNDIPSSLYEAASIDGASWWRQVWSITIPMLKRPFAFVLVADTVSNFLVFAPVQVLTKGGPEGSTNLLMYDIYSRAYTLSDVHRAQAEVVMLVLVMLIIVAIQFRLLRSED